MAISSHVLGVEGSGPGSLVPSARCRLQQRSLAIDPGSSAQFALLRTTPVDVLVVRGQDRDAGRSARCLTVPLGASETRPRRNVIEVRAKSVWGPSRPGWKLSGNPLLHPFHITEQPMLGRAVRRLPLARLLRNTRCDALNCRWPAWLGQLRPQQALYRHDEHISPSCQPIRLASSSSSTRWKARQNRDSYTRDAKVAGLKSRAAYKLLEINDKYRLFRRGDTVVDLGYAPGSWSQVAFNRTSPGGRVVGIDVIPAQPPRGVSTLQGDFLSPQIRGELRKFVADPMRGRPRPQHHLMQRAEDGEKDEGMTEEELEAENKSIVDLEKAMEDCESSPAAIKDKKVDGQRQRDEAEARVVDVVLSDMCEPWPLTGSTWIKSVSNPWRRMMNTSGMAFRDHAGSMVCSSSHLIRFTSFTALTDPSQDLCLAALEFCYDTLATGGHFLCKFYQGAEDHALEMRLRKLFEKVHRIKPDSSRKESKEAYFVGLRRKTGVPREAVLGGD
jgi:21S rRNA (uridine2791-2'-O)-methyltransferase